MPGTWRLTRRVKARGWPAPRSTPLVRVRARSGSATPRDRAKADVQQVGGQLLTDARFTAVVDGDNRGVEVQGDAVSVFGLTLKIDEKSEGPIECFRPDVVGTACAP